MRHLISAVLTGLLFLSLNRTYAQFDSGSGGAISDALSDNAAPVSMNVPPPQKAAQQQESCVWEMSLQTGELRSFTARPVDTSLKMYLTGNRQMRYYDSQDRWNWIRSDFGLDISPLSMGTMRAGRPILYAWEGLNGSILEASPTEFTNGTNFWNAHLRAQVHTTVRLHLEMADARNCPSARVRARYSGSGSAITRTSANSGCSAESKISIAGSLTGDHSYTLMSGNSTGSLNRQSSGITVKAINLPIPIPLVGGRFRVDEHGATLNLAGIEVGSVGNNEVAQGADLRLSGEAGGNYEELPYTVAWNSYLDINMSARSNGGISKFAHALASTNMTHRIEYFEGVLPDEQGRYSATAFSLEMGPRGRNSGSWPVCDLPLMVTVGDTRQFICVDSFAQESDNNPINISRLNLRQRLLLKIIGNSIEIRRMDDGVELEPVRGVTVTGPETANTSNTGR